MKRLCAAALAAVLTALLAAAAAPRKAEAQPAPAFRRNDCPIVFVHGYMGFGQNGPGGLNYWGGRKDLPAGLRARGYEAWAVEVGPASSNWDRACELFAAIRGGRVDYGEAHARAAGHGRFGGAYPGLPVEWGPGRPVHLVGHSMGGQTARVLVRLLEEGSAAERAATPEGGLSPLFAGGRAADWVASVTTLSTPHDGTPAAYRFSPADRGLRALAAGLYWRAVNGRLTGAGRRAGLDLRLQAWGLEPSPGESCARFRRRFVQAESWWRSRDTGAWDASPEGARELNLWVAACPEVYYYSWAAEKTTRNCLDGREVPEPGMTWLFDSLSAFIGRVPDKAWRPNDGVVSTCSMDGPSVGSADRIVALAGDALADEPPAGEPCPGVWNFLGVLPSMDHLDLIGLPCGREAPAGYGSLEDWYLAIAERLAALPRMMSQSEE